MNLLGTLVILAIALQLVADAHGADMQQVRQMVEWPAGAKFLTLILKYPLLFAGAAGSLIGALVVASYQKKDRFQQFMVNASISICITPAVFAFSGQPATWDRWLACSLILGIVSGAILKIWISPAVQEAAKQAVAHQILDRLAGGDEKPTKSQSD
jgi:predicted exporter